MSLIPQLLHGPSDRPSALAAFLSRRLVEKRLLSPEQVNEVLDRQCRDGLGFAEALTASGLVRQSTIDAVLRDPPMPPHSINETGLSEHFLTGLAIKLLSISGPASAGELARRLGLTAPVAAELLSLLRHDGQCEATRSASYSLVDQRYSLTAAGRRRAQELLAESRYVGVAPVALEDYAFRVEIQSIRNTPVIPGVLRECLADLVFPPGVIDRLGQAISSGKALLLYGTPGNGKTAICRKLAHLHTDTIFIPYAITVADDVITVFDPAAHRPVGDPMPEEGADALRPTHDARWVRAARPVITLTEPAARRALDIDHDGARGFSRVPAHIKANGGILVVDDLGRGRQGHEDFLSRWLAPLERGRDFLALRTGTLIEVPYDALTIFATSRPPQDLDPSVLRRIPYKIEVPAPSAGSYREILAAACRRRGLGCPRELAEWLLQRYRQERTVPAACHPEALLDQVLDFCRYHGISPKLNAELLDLAWTNYFTRGGESR